MFDNLWVLCRECNLGKGDRYSDDSQSRETNSAQAIAYAAKRRWPSDNQHKGQKGKISLALRVDVLKRDNHSCQKCGKRAPGVALHVEYLMPISEGGEITFENLRVLCEKHSEPLKNAETRNTPP